MPFSPQGGDIHIDINADDNASRDIERIKDKLESLRNVGFGVSASMGRVASTVDEVSDNLAGIVGSSVAASGSFMTLSNRADAAADEIDDVGNQSTQSATRITALGGASTSTAGAMAALGTVSTVSLIPSLAALSTVAVPLVGTMTALGAAMGGVVSGMGAVVGTGLFAYGKKLVKQNKEQLAQTKKKISRLESLKEQTGSLTKEQQKQLKSLRKQKKQIAETTTVTGALGEAFEPVQEQLAETAQEMGTQFIPLIEDAIEALPQLIRNIQDSVGSLEPFAESLRELGNTAFEVVPDIVAQVMDMGREILPEFTQISKNILTGVVPALKALEEVAGEVIPLFEGLGSAVVELLPVLNDFGLMLLEELVPRIRRSLRFILDLNEAMDGWLIKGALVVSAVSSIVSVLGTLGTAVSGAVSAIGSVVAILGGPLTLAIAGVVAAVGGLWYAWDNNLGNIQGKTQDVVSDIQKFLSAFSDDVESLESTTTDSINQVISTFSTLSDEAESLYKTVSDAFTLTSKQSDSLQKNVSENLSLLEGAVESLGDAITWVVNNHTEPMLQRMSKLAEVHLGETVDEFIETFNVVMNRVQWFVGVFVDLWRRYGDEIMAVIKPTLKALRILFAGVFDAIFTTIRVILNLIQGDWAEAWTAIENYFRRTVGRLDSLLTVFKNIFVAGVKLIASVVVDIWNGMWGAIENAVSSGINSIVSWVKSIGVSDVKAAFKFIGSAIRRVFMSVFNFHKGVGQFVTGLIGDMVTYFKGDAKSDAKTGTRLMLKAVSGAFKGLVTEVIGPSGIVRTMIGKIVKYLTGDAWSDLKKAFNELVDVGMAAFRGLYEGLIGNSVVKDMINEIARYLTGGRGYSLISGAFQTLKVSAMNYLLSLKIQGMDAIEGFVVDLQNAIGNAVEWANNKLDDIQATVTRDDGSTSTTMVSTPDKEFWEVVIGEDQNASSGGGGTVPNPATGGHTRLPRLAAGGIVDKATQAIIGEGSSPEAVIPLDKLSSMMDMTYSAGVGAESTSVDVTLRVEGDDELTRLIRENAEVVVEQNEEDKQDRLRRL